MKEDYEGFIQSELQDTANLSHLSPIKQGIKIQPDKEFARGIK